MEKILFWILFWIVFRNSVCMFDPCKNNTNFPAVRLGSRNQHCERESIDVTLCDFFLEDAWYISKDALLSNRCPQSPGNCGVTNPAYLDGTYPDVSEGIVDRVACTKQGSDCCHATVPIQIKNCSGFFVYHLKPLKDCTSAYCFDSSLPCVITTTTSPTSPTVSTAEVHERSNDDHNSKAYLTMIIGATVGAFVVCAFAIVIVIIYWSKKRMTVAEMPLPDKDGTVPSAPPPPYSVHDNVSK